MKTSQRRSRRLVSPPLFSRTLLAGVYFAGLWCGSPARLSFAQESAAKTEETTVQHTNALAQETSPYLLQHAHNPVNWYPWGEEALELARQQNKPIFLSVGYSTCYWCHVMERESFENEAVAAVLNEHYIAVKVDREQHPDIDEQYLLATQFVTGRSGWPNSVWLTPDGRPWMAGTYLPREQFIEALQQLAKIWREQPNAVQRQADVLAAAIKNALANPLRSVDPEVLVGSELLDHALSQIQEAFDELHGGFGTAPKFPQHGHLRVLAALAESSDDPQPLHMLTSTLDAMWQGGIHDHIGGGFHRYSTDNQWLLPHFEKMLYDNAQLMAAYADGYRLTQHARYREAVADIYAWLRREMTHDAGGFYTALDSESEGEEGKYYVWTVAELEAVLGAEDARRFSRIYRFEAEGNFAEEATGQRNGGNIPHLNDSLEQIASNEQLEVEVLRGELATMRDKLLEARSRRAYPHLDDKILASWNGLMISGLARAGRLLEEPQYTAAAAQAADFVLREMTGENGLLYRSWRDGNAELPGYLDDYAFLARGLLDLYEATGDARRLDQARGLAEAMLTRFEDAQHGGVFFTSEEHPLLLARSKNVLGSGNLPLGNGVAAETLLRLGTADGPGVSDWDAASQQRYLRSAERAIESLSGFMARSPGAAESLLVAQMMLTETRPPTTPSAPQAAAPPSGEATPRHPPVTVVAAATPHQLRRGDSFEITVTLQIDAGWHLYGENPELDFVIPTTVKLLADDAFEVGSVELPEAVEREDPIFEQPLHLYEDTVVFRIPLTVAAAASHGPQRLAIEVQTQACDATRCLAARKQLLELQVTLLPDEHED